MSLQVYDGGRNGRPKPEPDGVLASGAPPSPGPLPVELTSHLRRGEALVWWGEKTDIAWGPLGLTLALLLVVLGLVTLFAPSFWRGEWSGMWPPLLVLLSPVLAVFGREWLSRRTLLVTQDGIVAIDMRDHAQRLPYAALRRVRRDLLRGGLRLEGANTAVVIPGPLMQDTRRAIAVARAGMLGSGSEIDDPLRWMPRS